MTNTTTNLSNKVLLNVNISTYRKIKPKLGQISTNLGFNFTNLP